MIQFFDIVLRRWLNDEEKRSEAIYCQGKAKIGTPRSEITLDVWVVMPNHIHGIVCIHDHVGVHVMRPGDLHTNNRASIGAPLHTDHPLVAF